MARDFHFFVPHSTIRVKGGRLTSKPYTDFRTLMHEAVELHTVKNCPLTYLIGNREYRIEPMDFLFINSEVPHQLKFSEDSEPYYIKWVPESAAERNIEKSLAHFFMDKKDAILIKAGTPLNLALHQCFDVIYAEWRERKDSYDAFIRAEVQKIQALLYREKILIDPQVFLPHLRSDSVARLLPIFNYIETHYAENITLEQTAALFNLNKSYFCRLFKQTTGASFVSFLNYLRISKAEELLLCEKSLAEIAEQVGFASVSYFSRTFKKIKSMPPQQYKHILLRR